jgi:hypothetical protein
MKTLSAAILPLSLLIAAASLAAEPAATPEPPVSVNSYWRYWLTARPPLFSTPIVEKNGKKTTELGVPRGWHIWGAPRGITTADPTAGWEAADFDDSYWSVARWPIMMGQELNPWDQPLTYRRMAARVRFDVPDPAAVKNLKLTVNYRGGLVAYVNGQEVDRGHLPAGALSADAFAEGYPAGAYCPADAKEAAGIAKALAYHGTWNACIYGDYRNRPELQAVATEIRKRRDRSRTIDIPAKLLRKGANVLALDLRQAPIAPEAAGWDWGWEGYCISFWTHLKVDDLSLAAEPAGAIRPVVRPQGTQLWGEDVHRWVFTSDFLEPGVKARAVEILAARGGTFSGQAVFETSAGAQGLTASVSDLAGPGGAKIPAAAISVRYGVPLTLVKMLENYGRGALRTAFPDQAIIRYAESLGLGAEAAARRGSNRMLELAGKSNLAFFDQLTATPPAAVPANSSQSIWLTVQIPRDAAPGDYAGKLMVRPGSEPEFALDVKIAVTGFTLVPPQEWTTFVGLEESPYAVAKGYSLPLWGDEHWKRVEQCMALLGGVGNRLIQAPLIAGTDMGNAESMVPWVKLARQSPQGDGGKGEGYEYDWSVLDRYLELARKHCARPLALVALVHPPSDLKGKKLAVTVIDGGARKPLELPEPGSPEFNKLWLPFAKAFVAHVREKKLAETVHWGIFFDECPETLRSMAEVLAAELPDVGWMRSSHNGNSTKPFPKDSKARVDLDNHIREFVEPDWSKGGVGRKGWSRTDLNLLYPRVASKITALEGYPSLWHLRELPELAITSDARGFGRIGADLWDRSTGGWFMPAVLYVLYPGKSGVEGSAQYEMLREGLQECEARIAIEKKDPEAAILKERAGAAWLLPGGAPDCRTGEFYGGWQARSRTLYEVAGKP